MLGYPQDELWVEWLPSIHRAIAVPSEKIAIPTLQNCREHAEIQAYWECLEYLLGILIGWEDQGTGLAWWYSNGKSTFDDPRLELVASHWNDEGQLDCYAAHHWRKDFSCFDPEQLSPTDMSLRGGFKDLEWWRSFKAEGKKWQYDPFYGGSNPLHLGISQHICLLKAGTEAHCYRSSASKDDLSGVVISGHFRSWRIDLDEFSNSLPSAPGRSWRIEVFDRVTGYLGLFRKSRMSEKWFQGRHMIHQAGSLTP